MSTGGSASTGGSMSTTGGSVSTGGSASTGGSVSTGGCGTSVAFSAQVQPIFTANCTSAGCHTGNRPAASLTLASGASYADLVNVGSSECASRMLVKPGVVAESYLVDKLLGQKLCSGSQMPKTGSSLPAADISTITRWICQGAAKN